MNVERMSKFIELAKRINPHDVSMYDWVCGTSACIAGHAAQDPWFINQGLTLANGGRTSSGGLLRMPQYQDKYAYPALAAFLDINEEKAFYLFSGRGEPGMGAEAIIGFIRRAKDISPGVVI